MKLDKNEEQRRNYQYLEDQGTLIILDSFLMAEVMETPLLIKKKDMAYLFSFQEAATVIHHGEQVFLIFIPRFCHTSYAVRDQDWTRPKQNETTGRDQNWMRSRKKSIMVRTDTGRNETW